LPSLPSALVFAWKRTARAVAKDAVLNDGTEAFQTFSRDYLVSSFMPFINGSIGNSGI
jgi:hypothetical protein